MTKIISPDISMIKYLNDTHVNDMLQLPEEISASAVYF